MRSRRGCAYPRLSSIPQARKTQAMRYKRTLGVITAIAAYGACTIAVVFPPPRGALVRSESNVALQRQMLSDGTLGLQSVTCFTEPRSAATTADMRVCDRTWSALFCADSSGDWGDEAVVAVTGNSYTIVRHHVTYSGNCDASTA